jgi:hypothetical protein
MHAARSHAKPNLMQNKKTEKLASPEVLQRSAPRGMTADRHVTGSLHSLQGGRGRKEACEVNQLHWQQRRAAPGSPQHKHPRQ